MTGTADAEAHAGRRAPFALLLRHGRPDARLWAAVLTAVVGGAACAIAAQYGLKRLVDRMTAATPDHRDVFLSLAVFLALLGLESVCWRLGGWLGSRAVIRLGERVRLHLFAIVGAQSWSFIQRQVSGAIAGRVNAAAAAATAAARTIIWNLVPPCAELLGAVAVLAAVDIRLAAGLVVSSAAVVAGLHRFGQRGFPLHEAHHREAAEAAGSLGDVLSNLALVQAHGALEREQERLRGAFSLEGRAHQRSWAFLERLRAGHDIAFWLVTAGLLTAAIIAWSDGAITTGGVVITTTLALRVLSGSRELALSALGLAQQLGAVAEASAALQAPAREARRRPAPGRRSTSGKIELRDVHYTPDGGRPLFKNLGLHIPAGQQLGIAGPSGAGKSTLLRLVQGLVLPDAGSVSLNGKRLSEASSEAAHFAVVSQEVSLFHRSVAENLCHGRPDASWDEVLAVSRATGCDAFIRLLPQGYHTLVGERGIRLSGGQRQRIAIARALLRRTPVLLLDEASSALDSRAELEVQQAVFDRSGERTVLTVAHRLSTLAKCDRVIVLDHGDVLEDGSPAALRDGSGWFATTWHLQERALGSDAAQQRPDHRPR